MDITTSRGATCGFTSYEGRFEGLWRANFAENGVEGLLQGASVIRTLIEDRLSHFS